MDGRVKPGHDGWGMARLLAATTLVMLGLEPSIHRTQKAYWMLIWAGAERRLADTLTQRRSVTTRIGWRNR